VFADAGRHVCAAVLSAGVRCGFATGAASAVHGLRASRASVCVWVHPWRWRLCVCVFVCCVGLSRAAVPISACVLRVGWCAWAPACKARPRRRLCAASLAPQRCRGRQPVARRPAAGCWCLFDRLAPHLVGPPATRQWHGWASGAAASSWCLCCKRRPCSHLPPRRPLLPYLPSLSIAKNPSRVLHTC
jgi:hypothetical protein